MAAPAPLSPLAPRKYPALPDVEGVRFATIAAGVRYAGRVDVMLALFDEPASVAGVFTRSQCPSAPVDWCRANLAQGAARALVVNSGNANAFTGGIGVEAVRHVAAAVAKSTGAAHARINQGLQHIDQQIKGHKKHAQHENRPLQQGNIALENSRIE